MLIELYILLDGCTRELPYVLTHIRGGISSAYDPYTCRRMNIEGDSARECISSFMGLRFPNISQGRWINNLSNYDFNRVGSTYEFIIDENTEDTIDIVPSSWSNFSAAAENAASIIANAAAASALNAGVAEGSRVSRPPGAMARPPGEMAIHAPTYVPQCPDEGPSMPRRSPRRRYLTLVPRISFEETAASLPDKDLKLMRVVSLRVLRILTCGHDIGITRTGRRSVNLWQGHTQALIRYGMAIARELVRRGYRDTSMEEFRSHFVCELVTKPQWVFWPRLRMSHRAYINLRKLREGCARAIYEHLEGSDTGVREYLRTAGHTTIRTLSSRDIASLHLRLPEVNYSYMEIPNEEFVFPNQES